MESNGALVHTSVFHSSAPRLFYGRGEYDLLFNVDLVNLLLKNNGGGQKASFCYFCSLESFNRPRVLGGGLGQRVLFRTG